MQIELRQLHERLGMTTVYVTHDQREALTMSDRIAVINHGRVMQLYTPRRIYDRPANRFVADFVGESTFVKVARDGADAVAAGRLLNVASALPDAGSLQLMIRPERLTVMGTERPHDVNLFTGQVRDIVYQGDSALAYITLSDGTDVVMRASTRSGTAFDRIAAGGSVVLGLHRDDTVLIPDDGT